MEKYNKVGCLTIVSKNYISCARVLADSFLLNHPGSKFYVVLVDKNDGYIDPDQENFELLELQDIRIPRIDIFPYQYNILELNTAVKPFALKQLLETEELDKLAYIDPDITVYQALDKVWDNLEDHSIVITPHMREPFNDTAHPSELGIIQSGTYNLGFIGLRNNSDAIKLLNWWSERLYLNCVVDIPRGLFTDQKWIDLVPAYFEKTYILRCPSYNIAYWNLHERTLTVKNSKYFVDGEPLSFFHFSGYDPRKPYLLSKHQNRHDISESHALTAICNDYASRLFKHGLSETKKWPYAFKILPNGVDNTNEINKVVRRCIEQHISFPSPTNEVEEFCEFLLKPNRRIFGTQTSPIFHAVLDSRPDVVSHYQNAFNDANDPGFRSWLNGSGAVEMRLSKLIYGREHILELKNPVIKIADIYFSRPDILNAYNNAFRSESSFEKLVLWLENYGIKEYKDLSKNDIDQFLNARNGLHKILALYFQRGDLQKIFLDLPTEQGINKYRAWLLHNLPTLPANINESDIEFFSVWAKCNSDTLLKSVAAYNIEIRERLGGVPNVFKLVKLHQILNSVNIEISRRDLLEWLITEFMVSPREHLLIHYRSSRELQYLFSDAFENNSSTLNLVDNLVRGTELETVIDVTWLQELRSELDINCEKIESINVVGYFDAATGMGESSRSMLLTASKTGKKVCQLTLPNVYTDRVCLDVPLNGLLYGYPSWEAQLTIVVANADSTVEANKFLPAHYIGGKKVGYWVWETEELPKKWTNFAGYYDEIWTASKYCKAAIEKTIDKPVKVIPHVLQHSGIVEGATREEFSLPSDKVIFAYYFDQKSVIERKNPADLISVFNKTFGDRDDVMLLIKVNSSTPGHFEYERLKFKSGPNVVWLEETYSREKLQRLTSVIDIYVSLHRSEGFGLTCAEAIAAEKYVIASKYSGNLEFMNEAQHYLVEGEVVELARSYGPYKKGQKWFQFDMEIASDLLRNLYEYVKEGIKPDVLSKQYVENKLNPNDIACLLISDLGSLE